MERSKVNKLIIGTANFGLKYGINNNKKLEIDEIEQILKQASKSGCYGVDLAKAYGDAEEICGRFLKDTNLNIITKLPQIEHITVQNLKNLAIDSKNILSRCEHILLHNFDMYKNHKTTIKELFKIVLEEGISKHVGISIYHPDEAKMLLDDGFLDLSIEFPTNIFDQRFDNTLLKELKMANFTMFARSVFLQGLFFLNPNSLDLKFENAKKHLKKLNDLALTYNMPIYEMALKFVYFNDYIDGVLVGVDSQKQLSENINCLHTKSPKTVMCELKSLKIDDLEIILPYLW